MISINDSVFILIDVQAKLAEVMHGKDELFANLRKLIQGIRALKVPIVWTEQIPEKMGPTSPQIAELLAGETPMSKVSFSCCGEESFVKKLASLGRRNIILAGIETHVCLYQTACDLVAAGYHVEAVADCMSSRALENKAIALEKIKGCGASLTSVEIVLFELMRTATHPAFREILKLVR